MVSPFDLQHVCALTLLNGYGDISKGQRETPVVLLRPGVPRLHSVFSTDLRLRRRVLEVYTRA